MNSNMLRAPLVKSAALLVVISVLIYLTATSAEGSFFGSLGTLFIAAFRIVQLSLGLIISLLFCLAVLTAIFLGCVAMVSRESAINMWEGLRGVLSEKLLLTRSMVIKDVPRTTKTSRALDERELEERVLIALENSLDIVREDQTVADRNIEWLMERLDHLEQSENMAPLVKRLNEAAQQIDGVIAKVAQLHNQFGTLQNSVDTLMQSSTDKFLDQNVRELNSRLGEIEKNLVIMQKEISGLKEKAVTSSALGTNDEQAGSGTVAHRLFAHVKNAAMQAKIEELVTETLNTEMSYAQVIEHLVKNASGKTAKTIAAHPSLTKEYIRYRRRNG